MIEEQNSSSKRILLSVLGVAILIVAVVGVSFAAFTFTNISDENKISTGTITITYTEPNNGITINDALPMSDASALALKGETNVFEFTVSTNASGTLDIPYEINLTDVTGSSFEDGTEALTDEEVKVALTDNQGTNLVEPTLMSTVKESESQLRAGSYKLYSKTDKHTGEGSDVTTTYQLRMWVADTVNFGDGGKDATTTKYTYKLKVNVDSQVKPIGSVE